MSIEDNLYNKKWQKFLKQIWPFKYIPFVDFVLAAGSLATGNLREESDFDVIVGMRQGRIFTARFFCWLIFGMFGWRAKHHPEQPLQYTVLLKRRHLSKDKICFNHFVTPAAYRLSPPHNKYWENLYQSLVPVYGDPNTIKKFFDANTDWAGPVNIGKYLNDTRYKYQKRGLVARWREWLFGGRFGDWLEQKLKRIQVAKIERSFKTQSGYKPRIIYNDNELEFHPDTKRIVELMNKM